MSYLNHVELCMGYFLWKNSGWDLSWTKELCLPTPTPPPHLRTLCESYDSVRKLWEKAKNLNLLNLFLLLWFFFHKMGLSAMSLKDTIVFIRWYTHASFLSSYLVSIHKPPPPPPPAKHYLPYFSLSLFYTPWLQKMTGEGICGADKTKEKNMGLLQYITSTL